VGADGQVAGARFLLDSHTGGVEITGTVPSSGPLVVVSNHPGLSDAMALWVGIGREDLRTVAAERDLLRSMPRVCEKLLVIDPARPTGVIRAAAEALQSGGAILTFPAGKIEPDPARYADSAHEPLPSLHQAWSESYRLFARKRPDTTFIRATVSNVISREAVDFWPLRFIRDRAQRDWVAATLQVGVRRWKENVVQVHFEPI
jgi:hypothetical protein